MDTAGILTALQCCKLFSTLSEETVEHTLLPAGTMRSFAKNTALIMPQERLDRFGVILTGRVCIRQIFSDGLSSLMTVLRPSYVLGVDLIGTESHRSPYYALAETAVQVYFFPASVILNPGALPEPDRMEVWRRMLTFLSHENMRKHYRLAILSQRGLRDRILIYLTMQAERRGTNCFRIPFSRDELAEFLCVNRSALSHELSIMEQEGLILFHKNQFTLLLEGEQRSPWSMERP